MKRFISTPFVHLFNMFSIILPLTLFAVIHSIDPNAFNYFLLLLSLIASFGLINGIFTQYIIDEKSLTLKSLTKKIVINFNEIHSIYQQRPGALAKFSVVISSNTKTITLTNLTKDYEEALKLIVERGLDQAKIKVDSAVMSKISK